MKIIERQPLTSIEPNREILTPDSIIIRPRIAREELNYNFKFHNLRHSFELDALT